MDDLDLLAQLGRQHPSAARVLVSGSEDPHLGEMHGHLAAGNRTEALARANARVRISLPTC
jgi:hypothetical protein